MDTPFFKKKSLGQHFLTSPVVPKWMCEAADITAEDTVLEIGPGTGVLTKELLSRAHTVIAVETDERALAVLHNTYADEIAEGKLILISADIRTYTLDELPLTDHGFKVVANIPYYLSGMLFRKLLESDIQPSLLVFLVQKEVATRISRSEKESLLSLSVQAFGEPTYVKTVQRGHFNPPPKVDSAIIKVADIARTNFTHISPEYFFTLLHIGFGQKRKQLIGNLAKHYARNTLLHIFSTLSISPVTRAEDLSLSEWLQLAALCERTFHPQTN